MREERRGPLPAAEEGSGGHNLSFCLIRRGEKLDRPVAAAVTHLHAVFLREAGESGKLQRGRKVSAHCAVFNPSQRPVSYLLEQCRNSKRTCDPRNMSTGMGSLICSAQRGLLLWYSTREWYSSAPGSPEPAATWP